MCSQTFTAAPAPAQHAGAVPSTSSAFGTTLGGYHTRNGHVEAQLGMHVLRCLELVGELASGAHTRMGIYLDDLAPKLDYVEIDTAIQTAANGTGMERSSGVGCACAGRVGNQGGQGSTDRCEACQSMAPPSNGTGNNQTVDARCWASLLAQRFNQAQIRQVGVAFSMDPSMLGPAVSAMWASGGRTGHPSPVDLSSILGSGPSVASLLVN